MSNYSTTASAERYIPCSEEDFRRLAEAMNLEEILSHDEGRYRTAKNERDIEGMEEAYHGFELEHDKDGVFLYSEGDSLTFEEIPDKAFAIFGEILTKAELPHVEIGMAFTCDKLSPNSEGGNYMRIYADGTYEEAQIVWAKKPKPTIKGRVSENNVVKG